MPDHAGDHNNMQRDRVWLAKSTRPEAHRLIGRQRLFRLLDRMREGRCVWLHAQAGAGKTTLVSTWIEARKRACLWYRLDADDADPLNFFLRIGRAAATVPHTRKQPMPHVASAQPALLESSARRFFEDLFARYPTPFVLVLDDYQTLPTDAKLHFILNLALDTVPDGSQIVFLSREDAPPAYARRRTDPRFLCLPADALKLGDGEARALAKMSQGHAPRDIDALNDLARGWVTGLLLLLRARDWTMPGDSQMVPQPVIDYFANEVYATIEPAVREFLTKTARLPYVTPALAAAATGRSDAGEVLVTLCRSQLFTEARSGAGEVYEYHPLFKRFLQVRSAECWPVHISTLGGFRVELNGRPLVFEGKAKAKPLELLQAVVAHGGRGVAVDTLIEALWPEAEGDAGQRSFDITLHRLRKLLGREDALTLSESKLSLAPGVVWTDIRAFEALVAMIEVANGTLDVGSAQDFGAQLLLHYPGEFLAQERLREWTLPRRGRLRCAFQRAALAIGARIENSCLWESAAAFYRGAIERDPQGEAFYQRLMRCLGRLGLASEVARAYLTLRGELRRTLGIAPSPQSEAICEELAPGFRAGLQSVADSPAEGAKTPLQPDEARSSCSPPPVE